MEQSRVLTIGPALKFLALFAGIYCSLAAILSTIPPASHHFTNVVTEGAGLILSHLGFFTEVSALALASGYAEIHFNSTVYRVNEDCTGLSIILLVVAAIVAIPTPLRLRILGVVLMGFLAASIGCMRIVILGFVAEFHTDLFNLFHTYLMEVATVGAMLWIFTIWCNFTIPFRRLSAS